MSHLRYFGVFGVHKLHCGAVWRQSFITFLGVVRVQYFRGESSTPPLGLSSFGNKGPKTVRVSEKSEFKKASVIGSRGKLRTRIRGGDSRPSAEGEDASDPPLRDRVSLDDHGQKALFMKCARWAAVRMKEKRGAG
jgi:hypothetical protein